MTPTLSEASFRAALAKAGLKLEGAAFAAALQGARRLRADIARIDAYLAQQETTS
jgi:hypothetical protein